MTKTEVSELVAVLMACYPNGRFPDGTVAAYELFLQELELERARHAVAHLVKTSKFMPTIAEVVSAYHERGERADVPYHRLFAPPRRERGLMKPNELHRAITEYLEKS